MANYDVLGFWVSSREGKVNPTETNRGGITERLYQRIGIRISATYKITIVIMGKDYLISGITLAENTGYALTFGFLEEEDGQGIGPLRFRRLVHIYLNSVLQA
jgi:hypothetical protein